MSLPIETQAACVIADIKGLELSAEDIDFIQQPEISGLILFSRNYQSPEQLKALTSHILSVRPNLLICVDQEGGRVQRFRDGFTLLPPMQSLESHYQTDPAQALELAQGLGLLMASEVIACGVHLSFAPVLDIERGISQVIGNRAFASNAAAVTELARAFIEGMNQAGMQAVGKHFPGHGAVSADSHVSLPIDERTSVEIDYDIQPFAQLILEQKLAGIMPAHVVYPALDKNNTAGFSTIWLQQVLRTKLGFKGVIFSDDLTMEGAACVGDYSARAEAALKAGANALLVCNKREAAQQVIDWMRANERWPHLDLSFLQPAKTAFNVLQLQQVKVLLKRFNLLPESP